MRDYDTGLKDMLKERELQVLRLIADGLSNKDIAQKLFISVATVRWHNRQIYQKLGTHSRTHAVAIAREMNLLEAPASTVGTPQTPNRPALTTCHSIRTPLLDASSTLKLLNGCSRQTAF